jgi:hypothetical protein
VIMRTGLTCIFLDTDKAERYYGHYEDAGIEAKTNASYGSARRLTVVGPVDPDDGAEQALSIRRPTVVLYDLPARRERLDGLHVRDARPIAAIPVFPLDRASSGASGPRRAASRPRPSSPGRCVDDAASPT